MKTHLSTTRTVWYQQQEISYQLEIKPVKNINLRIRRDGSIHVSANRQVPLGKIDGFVVEKGAYILSALRHFQELAQCSPRQKQYVSGETFYILGRELRLQVSEGSKDMICSDGVSLLLQTKNPSDTRRKECMVVKYLDQQCRDRFGEIMEELYPLFQKYGVPRPILRIRSMETRWGSCLSRKGIVTLNKRLLEMPRQCIEYVIMHELCHFMHPNHSRQFYDFLTMMMPDWKTRRLELNQRAGHGR